ncbi:MAG: hypothetical protein AAGA91_06910 [Pseudomonadota bacterium]
MREAPLTRIEQQWVPASIWWLAAGYGAAYAIFTFITQWHASLGRGPADPVVAGLSLLTGATVALLLVLPVAAVLLGRRAGESRLQIGDGQMVLSGLATTGIALSTITAFTLGGVSVVLALLLMRGGVLILAPVVDHLHRRTIRPVARLALLLSLAAVALPLMVKRDGGPTWPLLLTLAVYLTSYFIRLGVMNRAAKVLQPGVRARFCSREFLFTWCTLAIVVMIGVLWQTTVLNVSLPATIVPAGSAVAVGLSYSVVLVAGTLVYLDPRENSFTVPLNRAASVAGGVMGATLAWQTLVGSMPAMVDYLAAGIILIALVLLARDGWVLSVRSEQA